MKSFGSFLFISTFAVIGFALPYIGHAAPITYDFESDTVGQVPANTTVGAGTFEVQTDGILGKALHALTQQGVIAAINFDNFSGSNDQSVVWKQAYSSDNGRSGFTLRAQAQDTNVINSVGAKQGYLFHVYDTSNAYIWRVGSGSYTPLWSGSLAKAEPRWFKASAIGNQLSFSYSNDGVSYTTLGTATDSDYSSGNVQFTTGYGGTVGQDYVDDIIITNLDVPYVESIDAATADGFYNDGDTIEINVHFSEPVDVTNSPFLNLNTGSIANYISGSGTDTLTFEYYVWFGVNSADLDVYQVNLNVTGTITDPDNGNNADLSIPSGQNLADNADIVIDNIDPEIVSAVITASNEVTITYSEIVTNNTDSSYTNFGGSLAGRAVTGQGGNVNSDHIVLQLDGVALDGLGDGTIDVANDIVDRAGNSFAGATSLVVEGLAAADTQTEPFTSFTIAPPENGVAYYTDEPLAISFEIPEPMLHDSFTLTLTPSIGSPIVMGLMDANDSSLLSFSIDMEDIAAASEVRSTTAAIVPAETYTATLSYRDALGNPAVTASVSDIVVIDAVAPVLTLVQAIPANTKLDNAILRFTISKDCNIQATPPTSTKGEVVLLVEEPVVGQTIGATLQGMQQGGRYSFSISCVDDGDRESNTLSTGYFTIKSGQVVGSTAAAIARNTQAAKQCPVSELLSQNLKTGAHNGRYNSYTGGIVTQAHILQGHLNRLGFNSGVADGILGPISDAAIKRMQVSLGAKPDGYVGPITRGLLNNSCTTKTL